MKSTRTTDAKRKRYTRSSQVDDSALQSQSSTEVDFKSESVSKLKKAAGTTVTGKQSKKTESPYFDKSEKHKNKLELVSGTDKLEYLDSPLLTAKRRKTKKSDKDVTGVIATTTEPSEPLTASPKNISSTSTARARDPLPVGGEPDGNGGLNQPSPFNVEYSKSGRATCRTCDEIIKKGEVRVGHTPLFRGKVRFKYRVIEIIYRSIH